MNHIPRKDSKAKRSVGHFEVPFRLFSTTKTRYKNRSNVQMKVSYSLKRNDQPLCREVTGIDRFFTSAS